MRDSIGRSGGHARRIRLFTVRTLREILRDPLSFVICLGVPLVLLVAMYALFSPTEPWVTLDMLTPGIAVFSGAFAMLYMALLVSRDRATWFLTRLYSSPLTDGDFVLGYALPGILIGAGQLVICWAASAVTGLVAGETAWLGVGILRWWCALCLSVSCPAHCSRTRRRRGCPRWSYQARAFSVARGCRSNPCRRASAPSAHGSRSIQPSVPGVRRWRAMP